MSNLIYLLNYVPILYLIYCVNYNSFHLPHVRLLLMDFVSWFGGGCKILKFLIKTNLLRK